MNIPPKIRRFGDIARCQLVLGVAKSRLVVLQDRIKRSNGLLKQGWQQPFTLATGEIVRLAVNFNTSCIEIYAGPQPVFESIEMKEIIEELFYKLLIDCSTAKRLQSCSTT